MQQKKYITEQLENFPDPLLDQVIDFIEFLKEKQKKLKLQTLKISETSLKKDWLKAEEDEAWQRTWVSSSTCRLFVNPSVVRTSRSLGLSSITLDQQSNFS